MVDIGSYADHTEIIYGLLMVDLWSIQWAIFSSERWCALGRRPLFRWVHFIFRLFGRSGPFLAQFGKVWASILKVFRSMLAPFWRYVGPFGRKSWHLIGWLRDNLVQSGAI